MLNKLNYLVRVISNQSGVAKNYLEENVKNSKKLILTF